MDAFRTDQSDIALARDVLRVRFGQLIVNEMLKRRELPVPVHLALGHEAIAVGVGAALGPADALCLTHRNIHYNIARATALGPELNELRLRADGIAGGRLGSMNMRNPGRGIIYTSSILGNDLCVSAGVALADRALGRDSVTFVVTGDGAMEEGVFYETLEVLASFSLAAVVVVENNGWSLGTRIAERRCPIDAGSLAAAFGIPCERLSGNDVWAYADRLRHLRGEAVRRRGPVVVEADLATLGDWRGDPTAAEPDGRFINYHHGPARTVELAEWPVIHADGRDPVYMLTTRFDGERLRGLAREVLATLNEEAAP